MTNDKKEPKKSRVVTLKLIVSENEEYYDFYNADILTKEGKRLRGFGIPNPVLIPIEIIDFCGFNQEEIEQ